MLDPLGSGRAAKHEPLGRQLDVGGSKRRQKTGCWLARGANYGETLQRHDNVRASARVLAKLDSALRMRHAVGLPNSSESGRVFCGDSYCNRDPKTRTRIPAI